MTNIKQLTSKIYDFEKIAAIVADKNERKIEVSGNLANTHLENGKLIIEDENVTIDMMTPTALKQIWKSAGVNAGTAEFIAERLTNEEQSALYAREISGKIDANRMFRTITRQDGQRALYGVVSDQYRIMDNDVVINLLRNSGLNMVMVAGTEPRGYDHNKFRLVPEFFAPLSKGMHIPMLEITNSESGLGALSFFSGAYTLKCTNGMMILESGNQTRQIHLGTKEIQFPDLSTILNKSEEKVEMLYQAGTRYLNNGDKVHILNFAKDRGLSHSDIDAMVVTANTEYNNGRTLEDVIGAFTQSAQRFAVVDTQKRTQIERVAGDVLTAFKVAA